MVIGGSSFEEFYLGKEAFSRKLFAPFDSGDEIILRFWSPRAEAVFLCGDFNGWKRDTHPLLHCEELGIWEIRLPIGTLENGSRYKFAVYTHSSIELKSDPYAISAESLGGRASVFSLETEETKNYRNDIAWHLYAEKTFGLNEKGKLKSFPLNIYRVEMPALLLSENGERKNDFKETAKRLAGYLKTYGYTHIELSSVFCGAFALPCELISPFELKYFVDLMHFCGIGVLFDFDSELEVSRDIYEMDGMPLYEYDVAEKGGIRRYYDLRRKEVKSYLLSAAVFRINEYHADGIVVRKSGDSLYPDTEENGEGTGSEFLKALISRLSKMYPELIVICGDASSLTRGVIYENSVYAEGLNEYFSTDPIFRKYIHARVASEKGFGGGTLLPLSTTCTDVLQSFFGSKEDKLRQLRVRMMYSLAYAGMLSSIGQALPWGFTASKNDCDEDIKNLGAFCQALGRYYLQHKELWRSDGGYRPVLTSEAERNILAFERVGESGERLLCVFNFSGCTVFEQHIPMKEDIIGATNSEHPELLWKVELSSDGNYSEQAEFKVSGGYLKLTLAAHSALFIAPSKALKPNCFGKKRLI